MLNLTTQDILNNRVLAMMFLATDLCLMKQYSTDEDKTAIKTVLSKYLNYTELQQVARMYDKAWPESETFEQILSVSELVEDNL